MQFHSEKSLLLVGAIVALLLAYVAWQRRHAPGAPALIAVQLSAAWWLLSSVIPLPDVAPDVDMFMRARLAFVGIVCMAPAALLFVLGYSGTIRRIRWQAIAMLAIEPALVLAAVASPAWHDSFFGAWRGGAPVDIAIGGPLFMAHTVYSYALLLASLAVMARHYRRASRHGKRQARYILIAFIFPVLGNILFVSQVSPDNIDYTPLGLVITVGIISFAIFQRGLLDLIAGAHQKLMRVVTDGIAVIDRQQRIVDSNAALWRIMERDSPASHGRYLADQAPELHARLAGLDDAPATIEFMRGGRQYLELRVFALLDDDANRLGQILLLRDISAAKATELALQKANAQLHTQLATINAMQDQLREQAVRDPLTGLYNRRFLTEALLRELATSQRNGARFAVAMIDVDHFKAVNDVHGHASGDAVLQALGALLARRSRAADAACRYGGEEFCVILHAADIDTAMRRVDQWREQFAALRFCFDGTTLSSTFSAGVACYPEHGGSEALLLTAADNALYAAKAAGRNRVHRP